MLTYPGGVLRVELPPLDSSTQFYRLQTQPAPGSQRQAPPSRLRSQYYVSPLITVASVIELLFIL
jgi:hypothetical protein